MEHADVAYPYLPEPIRAMNRLSTAKRADILTDLIRGMSMRSVARTYGVSINTVSKLLGDAGDAATAHHDERVRGIRGQAEIKCSQTWALSYDDGGTANAWTFVGIDTGSGLILTQLVGVDVRQATIALMRDLRTRLLDRPRLITDGLDASAEAVDLAFGDTGSRKRLDAQAGTAGESVYKLSIRSRIARRRVEKYVAIAHLFVLHHNFCRPRERHRGTPAMAAGIDNTARDMAWIVGLIDEHAPKPKRPKSYRRRSGKA